MRTRLLLPVVPALACLAFAAPAMAAEPEAVSENWAGYEATANTSDGFSSVSGGWTEPTAKCTSGGGSEYAAFWVGLGGGSDQSTALEQVGTQADCTAGGSAYYYAWYELVPSAPVKLDLKISAGDKIWARTAVSGDKVTIFVSDQTTGQKVSKTLTMTDATPDTSTAEWIAEAPSECTTSVESCTPLPLADFSTVTFNDAEATANGHTGTISDSSWNSEAIALETASDSPYGGGFGGYGAYGGDGYPQDAASSSAGAAPGSLSSNGGSFTVTYGAEATASDTSGDTSGYGNTTTSGDGYGTTTGEGYGSTTGDGYGYGYGDSGYGDSYGDGGAYGYGYGGSAYPGDSYGDSGGYSYGGGLGSGVYYYGS